MAAKRKAKKTAVPVEVQRYTLHHLVDALVSAHRWRNAAPELRDYHAKRLAAFERAFDLPQQDPDSSRYLRMFLRDVVKSLGTSVSPFAGMMEAPREIGELYQAFAPRIDAAEDQLKVELRALLMHVVAQLVPEGRTITDADLVRHGFDPEKTPEPDPYDFW